MRSDEQAVRRLEALQVGEPVADPGPDGKAGIDDQDVASLHGQLRPRQEQEAFGFRVGAQVVPVCDGVVVRHGQGVESQACGSVDERARRIGDAVLGIFGGMGMKIDLEHREMKAPPLSSHSRAAP